ncbi:MAG: hypothetical protein QM692_01510 [Thermomicrobiales bacterium]
MVTEALVRLGLDLAPQGIAAAPSPWLVLLALVLVWLALAGNRGPRARAR